ncbi:extracellular solute-binding protein [uncultured Paracoccus sp.]|uniref:ABC transporter substrate-binding protein n=1 Tax=uncultured Paracoccus sp. TaxID=189685 RepID=UPI002611DF7B|nr:extracellular solute-binding protein [uncultured Paracoccus sp.]
MLNRRNFLNLGLGAAAATAMTPFLGRAALAAEQDMRLFWFGSPGRAERTMAVAKLFEAANPGMTILGEVGGNDYWSKLTTMLAGGNAPDIFQLEPGRFADYAGRDTMLPLDDYLGSTIRTDRLQADSLKLGTVNGKVAGMPLSTNAFALLYDTEAFKSAGLTPPDRNTTWDDFATLCIEMTKAIDKPNVWAMGNAARYSYAFEPFLLQRGRKLYLENGQIGFDATDAADWYGYWESLAANGGCVSADVQAQDKLQIDSNPMSTGNAVMAIAFSNMIVGYQALQQNPVGITTLPVAEAGGASGLFYRAGLHFGIAKNAADPEMAARFLDFFINDREAGKILGVERGVPLNLDVRAEIAPSLDEVQTLSADYVEGIKDIVGAFPAQVPVGASELEARVYRTIADQVAFGQMTPAEAGQALVDQANAILG